MHVKCMIIHIYICNNKKRNKNCYFIFVICICTYIYIHIYIYICIYKFHIHGVVCMIVRHKENVLGSATYSDFDVSC